MKSISITGFAAVLACVSFATAASAATEKVIYSFQNNGVDGQNPAAGLINVNGTLYGTTFNGGTGGTVFSINPTTGTETVLYSFRNESTGAYPRASLINVKGTLYGTTDTAGCECGTVFSITLGGKEKRLHSFYGNLEASLVSVSGKLYGTTTTGGTGCSGSDGCGSVFSIDLKTGATKVLHNFQGGVFWGNADGAYPGGLIDVNGTLYGTTVAGGSHCPGSALGGCGTVFSINLKTGAEKVLYSFQHGNGGAAPEASLIDVNGTLYGTTAAGGTGRQCRDECGTVFSIDAKTGKESVLYSFCAKTDCGDGNGPAASLIDVNDTLYGTTEFGGAGGSDCTISGVNSGCGTVFSIDPKTGAETVLYSFTGGSDGNGPVARLINVNGTLYGTTEYGGTGSCPATFDTPAGCGTVFSITP